MMDENRDPAHELERLLEAELGARDEVIATLARRVIELCTAREDAKTREALLRAAVSEAREDVIQMAEAARVRHEEHNALLVRNIALEQRVSRLEQIPDAPNTPPDMARIRWYQAEFPDGSQLAIEVTPDGRVWHRERTTPTDTWSTPVELERQV